MKVGYDIVINIFVRYWNVIKLRFCTCLYIDKLFD